MALELHGARYLGHQHAPWWGHIHIYCMYSGCQQFILCRILLQCAVRRTFASLRASPSRVLVAVHARPMHHVPTSAAMGLWCASTSHITNALHFTPQIEPSVTSSWCIITYLSWFGTCINSLSFDISFFSCGFFPFKFVHVDGLKKQTFSIFELIMMICVEHTKIISKARKI